MSPDQVVKHFDFDHAAIARALDILPSAVSNWKRRGRVPYVQQLILEKVSQGKLRAVKPDKKFT